MIPQIVVIEEMMTGLNLVVPASMMACSIASPLPRFSFILSTRKIAIFTTIPISEINQIINAILYGFHVTNIPILAPSKAVKIEYKMIIGLPKELNSKTRIAKTKNNASQSAINVAFISSAFSSPSPALAELIPVGYEYV